MATITGKTIEELNSSNFLSSVTGNEIVPVYVRGTGTTTFQLKALKDYLGTSDDKTYIPITDDKGVDYRIYLKNGDLVKIKEEAFTGRVPSSGENNLYDGLIINSMYGAGTEAGVITPVSHSFIELYNFQEQEVNLKGLYLWYRAKSGSWQSLELQGIIPARHSFLIRCAQQMDPYSDSVTVPILDYDMEWDIKLSNQGFSVYLCIGSETPEDNPLRKTLDSLGQVSSTNGRYIDLLGAGGKKEDETVWAYETRYLHCMDKNTGIHRIDYANSGTKNIGSNALVKQNNEADCEPIDYTNCDTTKYRPRSLKDGRWTEFYDKVTQSQTSPALINISFGKEDTSRCFCFRTPVAREGFVYYRKVGENLWNSELTSMSIVKDMEGVSTVHKAKVSNLDVGVYEYKVGYEGCCSDIATFEVKNYNNQEQTINILWTSDQQSWTEREYNVWKIAAQHLRQNNGYKKYDFHLNTGDISQNGNRCWEWRLYYNYSGELVRNIPHMITAGNNDLVSKKFSDAYEHYIYEDNKFANSVYSFDLGFTHFICLNSNTDFTYVNGQGTEGGYASTDAFLQAQMDWFDQHMTEVNQRETKPRWVIVYAHLSPFTVGRTIRLQRWVAHFEKWKIDLVLCGHNHAYSRSKALKTGYDFDKSPAYNDYVTKVSGSSELKIVDEFQADGVTEIDRTEHKADGVVYILNHACGFKLSGKEKPITLPTSLQGTKHANADGAPWWIVKQKLPTNPCYATLSIGYDKIEYKFYEITGIIKYDQYKNTIVSDDLSKISDSLFDQLTINYSERNK